MMEDEDTGKKATIKLAPCESVIYTTAWPTFYIE